MGITLRNKASLLNSSECRRGGGEGGGGGEPIKGGGGGHCPGFKVMRGKTTKDSAGRDFSEGGANAGNISKGKRVRRAGSFLGATRLLGRTPRST